MNKLLPEAWGPNVLDTTTALKLPSRRAPVLDILVWTKCYAVMAAVLAEKFPKKAPQLFMYLCRITYAARNFQGVAWVAYDCQYCRQALAWGSLDWGQEDSSLYNEAFVGQARAVSHCGHCLSDLHTIGRCPD